VIYYLNGKFVEKSKAFIRVNDLGLLRGYGIFDYLKTYNRKPFHLDDHLWRFFVSAASLNLKPPFSPKKLKEIIFELIKKNKNFPPKADPPQAEKELSFRLVLTGGETDNGRTSKKPTFFIIVEPPHYYPKEVFEKGIKLITLNYRREFPGIKTINYLWAISQWGNALKEKAGEILYVHQGKVLEATTSNFFMVKNGVLFTPQNDILPGITKKVVIGLAKKNKIKVQEKNLSLKEVLRADECFITATDKEIMPVVKIDNRLIGKGKVGSQTKRLMELFKNLLKNH